MTTMIISVQSNTDARKVADALRLMKCVKKIEIQEDDFERIPGLPYTQEACVASLREAMEDVRAGRVYSADEVRAMFPKP